MLPRWAIIGTAMLLVAVAKTQAQDSDTSKRARLTEWRDQASEVASPADLQHAATGAAALLNDPNESIRSDAVVVLRLLSRRVDRRGGQRIQKGDSTEPKISGLLPLLMKAADDSAEHVRYGAIYALADTLDSEAVAKLRDKLKDPSQMVRVSAACLLTEFHDATGIEEIKKELRRLQKEKEPELVFKAELVLASLERITGKTFGPIPVEVAISSNSRVIEAGEKRYAELLDDWVAWWDWTPPAMPGAVEMERTIPELDRNRRHEIIAAAVKTVGDYMRSDLPRKGDLIPEDAWGTAIRDLKPLRVRFDRVNAAIVLKEDARSEEGFYISNPISSYAPVSKDFLEWAALTKPEDESFGHIYYFRKKKN